MPFTLSMVEGGGELTLRGADGPVLLENPTQVSGTVDDETGAMTGELTTPRTSIERPITDPFEATVYIDADFAEVSATTGSIDSDGNVTIQVRLRVDLDIDVNDPSILSAQCRATPIVLTMESVAPYVAAGDSGSVTLADADFTIPPVAESGTCFGIIREQVNEELAGSGHALSLALEGRLPVPAPPGDPSTTQLAVDPAGSSRLGQAVTMTATVAAGPEAEEPGPPAGLVDFFDDGDLLGTAELDAEGRASFTVDTLPSGTHPLTAHYRGQSPFDDSASEPVPHLVAPDPTITSGLPPFVALGSGVEFDLTIVNSQGGVAIAHPGVDVRMARPAPTPALGPDGLRLERLVGTTWTEVPLAFEANTATGSVRDPGWAPLLPGATLVVRLRLSATASMAGGRVSSRFALVDQPPAGAAVELAVSEGATTILETDRRASTIAVGNQFIPGRVLPATVRQGNLFTLRSVSLTPNAPGLGQPSGLMEIWLDGKRLPARAMNQPHAAGFTPTVEVNTPDFSGATGYQARMPVDARSGTLTIVVKYLGNDHYLPSQTSVTIDVMPSAGPIFDCATTVLNNPARLAFNLVGLASLPPRVVSGTEVPLSNMALMALFDRGSIVQRLPTTFPAGPSTVGTDPLVGIDLTFGPNGSGAATGYVTSNNTLMTATGTNPDMVVDLTGESGSVTIEGEPGEVVPVTLSAITLRYRDPAGGIPYIISCTPLEGPAPLGQVTVSGTTLSIEAPTPVREGQDVTLVADVSPASGTVEFFDGETSLGVAPVLDGRARLTVDDLAAGDHTLVARHSSGIEAGSSSDSATLSVIPRFDCPQFATAGNGAVVRLVYLELLGRCPDQGGFDHWVGRLDGGTSAQSFARTIARTPEAVGRVVDDAYVTMLGRPADAAGRAFWVGRLQADGRYDRLLADLGSSPEFWAQAGSTNTGFVTRVYERLLGRAPDTSGAQYWAGRLAAGTSRRDLVVSLANLDEPLGRLVTASYVEILGRPPLTGERADGITFLRATGDRSRLYAELIGRPEFATRAQDFPNPSS